MLKIPLTILLSLTVFIIVVGVLLLIFGSPKCDDLANSTAYYLKNSIDEVSKDSFPWWEDGGVPPDEELSYYRTAPITLCQDKGISYLETILGTTMEPQYQIYYERFPESGGGVWTEAYPWSGGAASSLRMWAFMRIGTGAFKLASKYLTTAGEFTTFFNHLGGKARKIVEEYGTENLDDVLKAAKLGSLAQEVGEEAINKPATWAIEVTKTGEAVKNIKAGVESGILVNAVDDKLHFIVSKTKKIVEIPVEYVDDAGNVETFMAVVYVQRQAGEIVDMTTDVSKAGLAGWEVLEVSPDQMYKQWLETMDESTRNIYKDIFIAESDLPAGTITQAITGKVRNSNYYKNFFQPVENKLKKIVKGFETAGYRTDLSVMTTKDIVGIKLALRTAVEDDDVAKMLLRQDSIRDTIAKALGKSPVEIQASHIKDFLSKVDLNGIAFLPRGSDMDIISSATKVISDSTSVYSSSDDLLADVLKYNPNLVEDTAKTLVITEGQAETRISDIISTQIFPSYITGVTDATQLTTESLKLNIVKLAQDYKVGDEKSAIQLANLLGFIEQNKGALPSSIRAPTGMTTDYFKTQAKKMIYIDGPQNLLNPASFYSKAIFANLQTEDCEGNSICVFSQAAMTEHPLYLDESAQKFSGNIRVWRPVEEWQRWAGWQAALQHVPAHPRFYVNSPCLANAKIWKTTLDGTATIFVYPEKVDVGDSASNYCYADSNLVNEYVAVWAISDVATVITTIWGFGAAKGATEIAKQVIDIADPVTLTQGIIEGAISWPGWPFKTMTWEQIASSRSKVGIEEIKLGSEMGE